MNRLKVNNKLWLISDTHFGHKNIVKYGARSESHETMMISEWIRLIHPEDQILHMGDVFFGTPSRWREILNWLPGEKFLMLGNHDHQKDSFYESCGFTLVDPFVKDNHAFTHRPATEKHPAPNDYWHTNIHGHIHNNPYSVDHDGELILGRKYINLSVEATEMRPVQLGGVWKR